MGKNDKKAMTEELEKRLKNANYQYTLNINGVQVVLLIDFQKDDVVYAALKQAGSPSISKDCRYVVGLSPIEDETVRFFAEATARGIIERIKKI